MLLKQSKELLIKILSLQMHFILETLEDWFYSGF